MLPGVRIEPATVRIPGRRASDRTIVQCSTNCSWTVFVNCRQFMYLVISFLVLRAGYGIWLYQFLIIAFLFTSHLKLKQWACCWFSLSFIQLNVLRQVRIISPISSWASLICWEIVEDLQKTHMPTSEFYRNLLPYLYRNIVAAVQRNCRSVDPKILDLWRFL